MKNLKHTTLAALVVATPLVGIASTAQAVETEYSKAIQLAWEDGTDPEEASTTFFGTPVTVPGDSATRTVTIKNNGPSDATLTAEIYGVEITDKNKPDVHHNTAHVDPDGAGTLYKGAGDQGDWYSDLKLSWNMNSKTGSNSFRELDTAGITQIYNAKLAKGQSIPLNMTYSIPIESTSGNKANVKNRIATFSVRFKLSGDTPTSTTTPPTSTSTTSTPPTSTTSTSVPPTSTTQPVTPTQHTSTPTTPGPRVNTGNEVNAKRMIFAAILGMIIAGFAVVAFRRTFKHD